MTGYVCDRCPLAFEVGCYGYWDLSGGCAKYVCRHCGTMHKIEHLQRRPDSLHAVDGPIRAMVETPLEAYDGQTHTSLHLPITEESWRLVGLVPTGEECQPGQLILPNCPQAVLDRVACAYCNRVGGLVSPAIGDNCPVCAGPLQWVYFDTIN